MRVPTVALCALALLVAEEASAEAIAPSPQSPAPSSLDAPSTPADLEAVAPISTLAAVATSAPESSPVEGSPGKMAVLAPLPSQAATPEAASEDAAVSLEPDAVADPAAMASSAVAEVTEIPVIPPPSPAIAPPESMMGPDGGRFSTERRSPTPEPASPAALEAAPLAQEAAPDAAPQVEESEVPSREDIEAIQERLRNVETPPADFGDVYEGSPAITIAVPSGYGADGGTGFVGFGFQTSVRDSDEADASMNLGIGLGDADEAVGVQLSYTLASFGANRDFGTGGFNAKVHRRLGDGWSIAAGWEGFLTIGDDPVDFEDSLYGAVTYVAATRPDLNDPFSRVALTAGLGNGRFRTLEAIEDEDDTLGVFGSMAVRIARPVSAIVEWTGQDLAVGLSIAPFPDFPLVITPALRDVAGAGDDPRLVLGAGVSFQF